MRTPTFLADLPLARTALAFAERRHREQRRASDDALFILHPLEVAALLHNTGHAETTVTAGILHDTIEDTGVRREEISERFGPEVAALVAAMTEDSTIEDFAARKAALRRQIENFGEDATAVYAADKVAKVRELRAQTTRDPSTLQGASAPGRPRLEHYVESAAMLERVAPDHALVRQLRFELEALEALPPRTGAITPEDVRLEPGREGPA